MINTNNISFNLYKAACDMDYNDYAENAADEIAAIERGLSALARSAENNEDLKTLCKAIETAFDFVY